MTPAILAEWCGPRYFFFLTLIDGQPVSYRCLSTLVHPGVEGFVRLRPDQIFMVDEYTVPVFRRRGITRRIAAAMAPTLVARGFREVVGIHRVDNGDTIAAVEAKGIPRVGTVTRGACRGTSGSRSRPPRHGPHPSPSPSWTSRSPLLPAPPLPL